MEITKEELVRAQLLLDKKLFEQLRRYAFKIKTSKSKIARQAIKKFIEEELNKN